jgi:hypothetical protein
MPRDEHASIIYQRKCTSTVRGGARYAPYISDCAGLKAHATCPEFYTSTSTVSSFISASPEALSDPPNEVSSVATLVNSTFDQEKFDSPYDIVIDKSGKSCSDKKQKPIVRTGIQQKKLDHFMLLVGEYNCIDHVPFFSLTDIDMACNIMVDVWPQTMIPTVFRLQSGAAFGYSPDTRGMSVNDFPATQQGSDLVSLKKFITELLKRSRSTAATFQTALCYLEAVRSRIPELQQAEIEGKGTRGEPVDHAIGRVSIAPEFVAVAEEENRKLARNRMWNEFFLLLC